MLPTKAQTRISALYLGEIGRARRRVDELRDKYPSAAASELVQRLIDAKKSWASAGGALSGLFGWVTLPADFAFVTALQLSLIMEVATVHRVNLKSDRARAEVLEVLGYSNGADALNVSARSAPKVLAQVARRLFAKGGFETLGRAVPVVAAPLSALLNNRDIQRAGEAAARFYGTIRQLQHRRSAS
jgi:hypothetical protein